MRTLSLTCENFAYHNITVYFIASLQVGLKENLWYKLIVFTGELTDPSTDRPHFPVVIICPAGRNLPPKRKKSIQRAATCLYYCPHVLEMALSHPGHLGDILVFGQNVLWLEPNLP